MTGSRKRAKGPARPKGPEKVGDVLGEFLEKSGLKESVLRVQCVEEWEERVGHAIARVTRARGVSGGSIVVEVKSSAWLMELNLMKAQILGRLNKDREEGRIQNIVFVLAEQ